MVVKLSIVQATDVKLKLKVCKVITPYKNWFNPFLWQTIVAEVKKNNSLR